VPAAGLCADRCAAHGSGVTLNAPELLALGSLSLSLLLRMLFRIAAGATLAILAGCSEWESDDGPRPIGYVGLFHPPAPAGVRTLAGAIVDPQVSFEYAVSHMQDPVGEMLWLEQMTHRDSQGTPHWKVLAVERLPPRATNTGIVFGNCRVGDVSTGGDGYTFALVQWEDQEILDSIVLAWRVEPLSARFVPLPPDQVRCVNEGYGA
jgi:hypothetical protein